MVYLTCEASRFDTDKKVCNASVVEGAGVAANPMVARTERMAKREIIVVVIVAGPCLQDDVAARKGINEL